MTDHCARHTTHVGECRDCYRISVYHAPQPAPARKTDRAESHKAVERIAKGLTRNRALILRLVFPPSGLNYREIAAKSGIFPTACSRVITSMVREGSLDIHHKDGRMAYYVPGNGLISYSDTMDEGDDL